MSYCRWSSDWGECDEKRWADVVGTGGAYRVSTDGEVWSGKTESLLRPVQNGRYFKVTIKRRDESQWRQFPVHQLVLESFVGARPVGAVCRHLNGDCSDNHLRNLVWGTQTENMQDRIRHGNNPNLRKVKCKHGHPYTPENTYTRRNGGRMCRACHRIRQAARRMSQ